MGPYATPQDSTGGAKWVYQCQVEGHKEGPSTSWATISAHVGKVHLGVRLVCPLCNKSFFNPDVLRCRRKTHDEIIATSLGKGVSFKIYLVCKSLFLILFVTIISASS